MENRNRYLRLTGVIFLVSAIIGGIIGLGGLIVVWSTKAEETNGMIETTRLVHRSLEATSTSLVLINDTLDKASRNIELIHGLISDMGGTLSDTKDLLDTAAGMVGTDMKGFITETQKSLVAVQESAQMVDSALRVVDSTLQFLDRFRPGGPIYKPRTPLQDSVAQVNRSLDPLPASFDKIQKDLNTSAAHAATMQGEVEALSKQVADIEVSLEQARVVSGEYRKIVDALGSNLDHFERQLPLRLNVLYLGITLFLLWVITASAGMLVNGLGMLRD